MDSPLIDPAPSGDLPFATPLPARIPAIAVALDAEGRIADDLTCRRCGYNLRMLKADAQCPECDAAVSLSMQGDYFKFAEPDWVETLASGINWIILGSALTILGSITLSFAIAFARLPFFYNQVFTTALSLITTIGFWRVTTPDPGKKETSSFNARVLTRYWTSIGLLISPWMQYAMLTIPAVQVAASLAMAPLGIIGTIAMFKYARQLAFGVPDPAMARGFRINMWGFIAISLLGTAVVAASAMFIAPVATAGPAPTSLGYVTATSQTGVPGATVTKKYSFPPSGSTTAPTAIYTASSAPLPSGFGMIAALGCASGICVLVFGIWTLILILRLRKALTRAGYDARYNWSTQSTGIHARTARPIQQ